jgi:glycosyltransferase involved in cell wall biosynthesis
MAIEHRNHNFPVIRVLCVNLEGSIAGAEQSFLMFVRFAPKTVQICAACPAGDLTDRLTNLGIRTYKISAPLVKFNHPLIRLFYLAIVNLQLLLIVFREKPQIIHANSTKAVLASGLAKVMTDKKLIWHVRDLRCPRLSAKICRRLSSKIIAVSRAVKDRLADSGIEAKFIEVIYNGIVIEGLEAKRKEKDLHLSVTFANIGQFVPWKRQLLFIEAAERFLQDGQKARFILIGDDIFGRDGKYKKEIVNRVKTSPFASDITIIGWQDNLASYWPQIDCLIHTADTEPFGRVIVEAMANGVPVIAAASCGPAEIITGGSTGILFDPDNIEELLKAMKTISGHRGLAHNLVINAREHIVSSFKARETAERIAKVYEELIAA